MKKVLCIILSLFIFILPLNVTVFAEETEEITQISEDGEYTVSGMTDMQTEEASDFFSKLISVFRKLMELLTGNKTVSKTKYVSYYDKNGILLWTVYLNAEFAFNGKQSVCKKAYTSYEIADKDWSVQSCESGKSGDTAWADFTVRQSKLGVKLKTITPHLTLRCDKNGNVS